MTDDTDEVTAWHEAGHAWAALFVGARVQSLSICPDNDDGPNRFGDTTILWNRRRFRQREIAEKLVWVALTGPVAEMIHPDFAMIKVLPRQRVSSKQVTSSCRPVHDMDNSHFVCPHRPLRHRPR